MIYISHGDEFIKRAGKIELIPRGRGAGEGREEREKMHARYFLFDVLTAGICVRKYFLISRHPLSLFPSVKSTPPDFFFPPCHSVCRARMPPADASFPPTCLFISPPTPPQLPRSFLDRRSGSRNGERRMGNDRLKLCRGRTNADGLALRSTDIICPPNSRPGKCTLALRSVALRCVAMY